MAAAQAAVKAAEVLPTTISVTTPLNAAPPKGKTFVWTQCDAPQCAEITSFLQPAVAAAGMNLKIVNYQTANPASLVAAMQQALQYNPVAVALVAQPYAVWSSVVPAYQNAGVKIIAYSVGPLTTNETVPVQIVDDANTADSAQLMANWFIADSNGTGKVLLWTVPQLGPLATFGTVFQSTVAKGCSGCKVTYMGEPYANVAAGKNIQDIVSALQRDPSIKYVISSDQALNTPLTSALKAAGITGVKVGGANIESADEQLIESGQEAVGIPTELNMVSWMMVDSALRIAENMAPATEAVKWTVITPSSKFTPSNSFNYPADWQEQFKQLWKVG